MNVLDRDLFELWRFVLAVACSIYATVVMGRSLWGWIVYLSGPDRTTTIMRNYVVVQLLRMKPGRFKGELLQLAAWSVLLVVLLRFHV